MSEITDILRRKIMFDDKNENFIIDTFIALPISYFKSDFDGNDFDDKMKTLRELNNSNPSKGEIYNNKISLLANIYNDYYMLGKDLVIKKIINADFGGNDSKINSILIKIIKKSNFVIDNDDTNLLRKFILKIHENKFSLDELQIILNAINEGTLKDLNINTNIYVDKTLH
jgi:hypothetical protein